MPAQLFQSFWHGPDLTPYEQLGLRSFLDHGHEVALYVYDPPRGVPAGVRLASAEAIVPRAEAFVLAGYDAQGGYVAFPNYFRFELLAQRGGWWVDLDVVCLSAEIPTFETFFALEQVGGKPCEVNNAVLRFPPGHELMRRCAQASRALGEQLRRRPEGVTRRDFASLGAAVIERLTAELGLCDAAHGPEACYPVHWTEVRSLLRPEKAAELVARTGASWMVHLWSSQLAALGVDKHRAPAAGSYLRQLMDRHGIEFPRRGRWRRLADRFGL